MLSTSMPEAAVDKHGDLLFRQGDVDIEGAVVLAVAEASSLQGFP
jgi:hypothetical protein